MTTLLKPDQNSTLDLDKLERLRDRGDKKIARCLLCSEDGGDRSASNLEITAGGFVSCWANPDHGLAVKRLIQGEWKPESRPSLRKAKPKPKPIPRPTAAQISRAFQYCARLASDAATAEGLAALRGWKFETVRDLALAADLGWNGKEIAFVYAHGVKLRGKRNGKRTFRWEFGGNRELWRGAFITLRNPKRVWITEGETDAITMIDRGFDNHDNGELVVGLPCADGWRREWGPLFKGREVVLVPDADEAGSKGMDKAKADLVTFADRVSIYRWGGTE